MIYIYQAFIVYWYACMVAMLVWYAGKVGKDKEEFSYLMWATIIIFSWIIVPHMMYLLYKNQKQN